MSIYSGFATRFQEESYDHCIDSLLYVLQKRIIKFYNQERTDESKFINIVNKIHHQMRAMEKNKYLDPKSSQAISQLVRFLVANQQAIELNEKIELQNHSLPSPKASIVQNSNEKPIKNTLWVEKKVEEAENNSPSNKAEKQVQTIDASNARNGKQLNADGRNEMGGLPKRKTSYHIGIKHSKSKITSRTNLSKERKYEQAEDKFERDEGKIPKNRRGSHYNQDTWNPAVKSKMAEMEKEMESKHHSRHQDLMSENNSDHQHEVHEIIKDYITKSKKNYLRGRPLKQSRDTQTLIQFNPF